MPVTADLGRLTGLGATEWVRRTRSGELSAATGVEAVDAELPALAGELAR